jgi:hypothetical protein
MLYLKRLDLFLQFLLPVFGMLIALFSNFWIGFYVGTTGIAFSQIMSLFLHLPAKKEFWYLNFPRRTYSYVLLFHIILELSGLTIFFLSEQGNPIEQFFNVDKTNHCTGEHNYGNAKQSLSEFIDVVEKPHILFVRINFFLLI